MILSDTAIRRPVFTTMVIGCIIVFGIVSFTEIGIDLFPRVEIPVITILSVLPGADPETIEQTVTDIIEEAVCSISGIKSLRSVSSEGVSQVVIQFELEKDIDVAYQEVQAKIGTVRSQLPTDLENPIVEKFDIDAAPIVALIVSGDMPMRQLTYIAKKTIKERLQRIRNVGQVKLVGGRERQIWLWIDRIKLEGYHLSVQDVENALRSEHIEYPGGRVETGTLEYVIKTKAEFASAEEMESMIVAYRNGVAIRIRDIGRVEDGLEEERSLARMNETRAVSLLIRRQSGTNTVQVASAIKAEVELLRKELDKQGIRIEISQDMSLYIGNSVREVQFHLVYGGGLAVLIVFVFLRNVRSMLISALVLPTAVIGSFTLMHTMGFTQNMITLLALSLAIGLLIDDSIVVQENTMRHVEEGMPARAAASFATNEIALAVLATTLSVVAVFVPVAFTKGIVGRFLYQFGITVAFAVMLSMFVSFTLDPMLSSRLLSKPKRGRLYQFSEYPFLLLDEAYRWLLARALRYRWLVIGIALLSFCGSGYIGKFLSFEFTPMEDQSEFNIRVTAPLGSALTTTDAICTKIRQRFQGVPWLEYTFTTIGADEMQRANEAVIYVKMKGKRERTISQGQAMGWTRQRLADIREAKLSIEIVSRISGGGLKWADVQLELRGKDLGRLERLGTDLMARMRELDGYVDIDTSYEHGKPEVNIYVNRNRAADMGVSPMVVASTIKTLVGGKEISKFRAEGERYDISIRFEDAYRNNPKDIDFVTVKNTRGQLVQLDNVADVVQEVGPVQIARYNRARQITILANLVPNRKILGDAMDELTRIMQSVQLPPGYSFGFAGRAEDMNESFVNLFFALYLGIIIIYMVLASQFESFIHPFTIMLSVPLAVIGALGALVLSGLTMSIFTMIGLIMLMGLASKNGILLVDFTNTLRERDHMERTAAILKAGPIRLRPILMTTLAMIFGMLPSAFGKGEGAESRVPMAVAIIGGLTTSTVLTLVVVPVVYSILDDLRHPAEWRLVKWLCRKKG